MACSFAEAGRNKFYVGLVEHSWLQVLGELIAETPDSVLAQELWLAAASSDQWWRRTQVTHDLGILSTFNHSHLGYYALLRCDVDDWLHPWFRGQTFG